MKIKLYMQTAIMSVVLVFFMSLYSLQALADSVVTTPKGTFRCDNACVVDEFGNVSDCCGGEVWKKVEDEPIKEA